MDRLLPVELLAAALVLLAILALSGCVDRGECLSSHSETVLIPQYIYGSNGEIQVMWYAPSEQTVCDRWEFPDGRPERKP